MTAQNDYISANQQLGTKVLVSFPTASLANKHVSANKYVGNAAVSCSRFGPKIKHKTPKVTKHQDRRLGNKMLAHKLLAQCQLNIATERRSNCCHNICETCPQLRRRLKHSRLKPELLIYYVALIGPGCRISGCMSCLSSNGQHALLNNMPIA